MLPKQKVFCAVFFLAWAEVLAHINALGGKIVQSLAIQCIHVGKPDRGMGEGQDVACVNQVLQPSLYCRQHTHFVIEPCQLFGTCPLQGIEVTEQQEMDWRDHKSFLLSRLFVCGWSRANQWQLPCRRGDNLQERNRAANKANKTQQENNTNKCLSICYHSL